MIPLAYPTPWAAFAGLVGVPLFGKRIVTLDALGTIRIAALEKAKLLWDGRPLAVACHAEEDRYAFFDVPLSLQPGVEHDYEVQIAGDKVTIRFKGLPLRVPDRNRPENPREQWLQWQVQRYLELGHMRDDEACSSLEGTTKSGVLRRVWPVIDKLWKESGQGEPLLSLIVKLARNRPLLEALNAIVRSPRKLLLRIREPQRIDRIQELDSACLRAYSRAPGRTPIQKAGWRQQLLAVVRRETVDLLENRVARWTLEAMVSMAVSFLARHRDMSRSARYQDVAQLRKFSSNILALLVQDQVSKLVQHPNTPTYCLQYESRYQLVWFAYRAIRRESRVVDDAWRWQPRLWGTTSRLLLGCLLRGLPSWGEIRSSTPYFRDEGFEGEWLSGPSTPGPFHTPAGACHVLDLREPSSLAAAAWLKLPKDAVGSGADWILVWPLRKKLLVIWASVSIANYERVPGVGELESKIMRLSDKSGWLWKGLLLLGEPETTPESTSWIDGAEHVFVLRVPSEVHRCWGDLEAGFQLAMESLDVA